MRPDHPEPAEESRDYTVRSGKFTGRSLRGLSQGEFLEMINEIPKDADATAGLRYLRSVLEHGGPAELISVVEQGQKIIMINGELTRADFTPDADEPPITLAEKKALKAARPDIMTRRFALLTAPSALIAGFTSVRLGLAGLENVLRVKEPPEAKGLEDKKESAIGRINKRLDDISSTPVEVLGTATLINEIGEMYDQYEPDKFRQISHAISEMAHSMGIGEATPTIRLKHARTSETQGRSR